MVDPIHKVDPNLMVEHIPLLELTIVDLMSNCAILLSIK